VKNDAPISSNTTELSAIYDVDHKLTKEEAVELRETESDYKDALAYVKDMIAPAMMRIDATKLQIGDTYIRTIFTYAYPDVLE
jgi:enolase